MADLVRLLPEIRMGDAVLRPGTIRRVVQRVGDEVLIPYPGHPGETLMLEYGEYANVTEPIHPKGEEANTNACGTQTPSSPEN